MKKWISWLSMFFLMTLIGGAKVEADVHEGVTPPGTQAKTAEPVAEDNLIEDPIEVETGDPTDDQWLTKSDLLTALSTLIQPLEEAEVDSSEKAKLYFGVAGTTGFEDLLSGATDPGLSAMVAYELPEGIWLEWEPSITDTSDVNYFRAGMKVYSGAMDVIVGGSFFRLEDETTYGGWAGVMLPITEGRFVRLVFDKPEETGSAVRLGYFIGGEME